MDVARWLGLTQPVDTVIISTKTGQSIKGVLVHRDRTAYILRAASIGSLDQNGVAQWQRLMGDVIIPADNVDYYQSALEPSILE